MQPKNKAFAARLFDGRSDRHPICVGIDPSPRLLHAWDLPDSVEGLERFSASVLEAVGEVVVAVKPQLAFYERFGSRGLAVLERLVVAARSTGTLVILDAKRGDIASTAAAYAEAFLDPGSPLAGDAVTVTPYVGVEALDDVFRLARKHDRGVFVLAFTSNAEGINLQNARRADGQTVAEHIVSHVRMINTEDAPIGSIGLVVGATVTGVAAPLDGFNGPILAPGIGAQGASPADIVANFGPLARQVLPTASRSILARGPNAGRVRGAADQLGNEFTALLRQLG